MVQADSIFLEASLHRSSSRDGVACVQGSLAFTDNEKKNVEHSIFSPWLLWSADSTWHEFQREVPL